MSEESYEEIHEIFRAHHILCTSLYEGKGYGSEFCNHMGIIVNRLRSNPDEPMRLVAEPDLICANCPNRTADGKCSHNANSVVDKDRRVMERFGLQENMVYTYREMCRHASEHITHDIYMEFCGKCPWRESGLCKYEDLCERLSVTVSA